MKLADIGRLLILAAIWGASFLCIRVAVPAFGPGALMTGRVGLAALFLAIIGLLWRKRLIWRGKVPHFLLLGLINSALPFFLFAYAAHWLTASVLSVLNATAPIWGAVLGVLFFRQPLSARLAFGLVLGVTGVGILVGFDAVVHCNPMRDWPSRPALELPVVMVWRLITPDGLKRSSRSLMHMAVCGAHCCGCCQSHYYNRRSRSQQSGKPGHC